VNQLKDNFNVNTTVVLLSSLMTWFNTPKTVDTSAEPDEEGEGEHKQEEEEKGEDIASMMKEL